MALGVATAITRQALVCLLTAWLPTGEEAQRRDNVSFVYFPGPQESLADRQCAASMWDENEPGRNRGLDESWDARNTCCSTFSLHSEKSMNLFSHSFPFFFFYVKR